MILAILILSEKLSCLEIALNIIAIIASILVTVGDHQKSGHQYTSNHYLALVFLLLNPVFIGMSAVALRKMKKTSSETLTTWTNIVQSIFMGTAMWALGQSFMYYPAIFSMVDWVMLLGMTLSVIGSQTFKLLAFQNQAASKLQVIGNLQMVYQFLFDVFLFNVNFSTLQYWGIGVTVITFVLDIYMTVSSPADDIPGEEEKEKADGDIRETADIEEAKSVAESTQAQLDMNEPLIVSDGKAAAGAYQRRKRVEPASSLLMGTGLSSVASTQSSDYERRQLIDVGTSGETMECAKKKRAKESMLIQSLTSESSSLGNTSAEIGSPPGRRRNAQSKRTFSNVSGRLKQEVMEYD